MSKTPSNPCPYSAELQTFILSKYDPLLGIVKTLNERLHATNKDRFKLQQRVDALERDLQELRLVMVNKNTHTTPLQNVVDDLRDSDVVRLTETNLRLNAPWLFSCALDMPTSTIQLLLDFLPDQTSELDVRDWKREADMWIDFLENLPDAVAFDRPHSLGLAELRISVRSALLNLVKQEVLLIVRNVPGKALAEKQSGSLALVGILCASVGEACRKSDQNGRVNAGRIVVVLEGDNVGSKVQVGDAKFAVEPLQ